MVLEKIRVLHTHTGLAVAMFANSVKLDSFDSE